MLLNAPDWWMSGCVGDAGEDLHKVLWLKSRSSEVWLERRTHYTRSTGVMSMVCVRRHPEPDWCLQRAAIYVPFLAFLWTCCGFADNM